MIAGLVAASQEAAASAPEARDAAPLLTGNGAPADWDAPVPGTGAEVFSDVADSLAAGSAAPTSCTASPTMCWRRRSWRRRPDCAGATPSPPVRWRSTPNATAPAPGRASARPISSMCQPIRCSSSCRRGWAGPAQRRAAGRPLRDDHAAVDGGRHDDLPRLVDGPAAARRRAAPRCRRPAAEPGWGSGSPTCR